MSCAIGEDLPAGGSSSQHKGEETNSNEPTLMLFFINGMLTAEREASLDALELGEFLGMKVVSIYNRTRGLFWDCMIDVRLYCGGSSPAVGIAREKIEEVLGGEAVTVVTIAHSQGAMVIKKAISLLSRAERARLGVITLAAPVRVEAADGVLFAENLAATRDAISRLANFKRRRHQGDTPTKIIILESAKGVKFDHRFLGGTYQRAGWPRLLEIIHGLKESLLTAVTKKSSDK